MICGIQRTFFVHSQVEALLYISERVDIGRGEVPSDTPEMRLMQLIAGFGAAVDSDIIKSNFHDNTGRQGEGRTEPFDGQFPDALIQLVELLFCAFSTYFTDGNERFFKPMVLIDPYAQGEIRVVSS